MLFFGGIEFLERSGLAETRRFVYKITITGATASARDFAGTMADSTVADHTVMVAP